ncbi:DUF2690 domain-containing protein [Streptomyces sp. NPDC101152]|uniref:DUF2690 domain-containing protein n=1 Tax=Streptomyces sp. NPDC101152 TaxID=3366116 RepID=UPI003822BFB8
MNVNKRLSIGGTVVSLTAAVLVGTGGSAQAATYDGQDPIASGCAASAITAEQNNIFIPSGIAVGVIQLRYSTACRTVWARVVSTVPNGEAEVGRNPPNSASQWCGGSNLQWSSTVGDYTCYTPMLNDANMTSYAYGDIETDQGGGSSSTASY